MKRPIIEFSGSRVVRSLKCIQKIYGDPQQNRSRVLELFDSPEEAEIYLAMMTDNGFNLRDEKKAHIFREAFRRMNMSGQHLRTLVLRGLRLGPSSMITLCNIIGRIDLIHLDISDNPVMDSGMSSIKSILAMNKLHSLGLASVMLSEAGLRVILDSLANNTALLSIDLGIAPKSLFTNPLGLEGAKYLAVVLINNTKLAELRLAQNSIGTNGAIVLSKALRQNSTLKRLAVVRNGIGCQGAIQLMKFGKQLSKMELGGNQLRNTVCFEIKQYLRGNGRLKSLRLQQNKIDAEGVSTLIGGLQLSDLLELDLQSNKVGDKGVLLLSLALADVSFRCHQRLHKLNLSSNGLTEEGASQIAAALKVCQLRELNLSCNSIRDAGLCKIGEALHGQSKLAVLIVNFCEIGDPAITQFLTRILKSPQLVDFRCANNFISEKCEKQIIELVERNSSIRKIDLQGNRLSLACISKIKASAQVNRLQFQNSLPAKLSRQMYKLKFDLKRLSDSSQSIRVPDEIVRLRAERDRIAKELLQVEKRYGWTSRTGIRSSDSTTRAGANSSRTSYSSCGSRRRGWTKSCGRRRARRRRGAAGRARRGRGSGERRRSE